LAETYVSNIKVGQTGYGWMLSEEGIEIYCPFPDHTGKNVRDLLNGSESLERIINLADEQIAGFNEYYQNDFTTEPSIKIKKFTYHEPIFLPNTYWTIIVTAPESEVFELMHGFRNNFVLIVIVFAIGIGVFAYIYHKRKLRVAETIREERELYSRISEETGQVFYDLNISTGKIIWGGAIKATLGYSKEDISNININEWEKLIHPKDKEKIINDLQKTISDKTSFNCEYRFTKKNGKFIYIEDNGILLNPGSPNAERLVGIMRDITDRKKTEKKLKRSRDELEKLVQARTEELNEKNKQLAADIDFRKKIEVELRLAKESAEVSDKLKSEFLAQMSHEIRTPISTILNFTSLLKMEFEDKTNDSFESFESIENAAARLIRTIDLILNLSDIEAGTYKPEFQQISLSQDVLKPLVNEFSVKAKNKGLQLVFENNLSSDKANLDLYTVSQIIANLIDNAIKYTNDGSVKIRLTEYDNTLNCEITDTGIGISKEYLPDIFKVFSQEEQGYTRRYEGSGLGMALVKKYCEINDINISVSSEKGVGSTFGLEIKKI
jgi:PAS domain S-box-containing protein